jgi:hypothetical protein
MRKTIHIAALCAILLAGCMQIELGAIPLNANHETAEWEIIEAESDIQTINLEEWTAIPVNGEHMPPIWGSPDNMQLKDGYLLYSASEYGSDNLVTYSLNRADIKSGLMLDAIVTHTQTLESFYAPPAFTSDAIVVLTSTSIQRYDYSLQLQDEVPLSRKTLDMLSGDYVRVSFTNQGNGLLLNSIDGLPAVFDIATEELRVMRPLILPNGAEPETFSPFETTTEDDVFTFMVRGDEPFPYYHMLYNLREGRIINYLEIGGHSSGDLMPDESGNDNLYKWFDLTTNTGYAAPGSKGLWWPAGASRTGLMYKKPYGYGVETLEIADFSAQSIYHFELDGNTVFHNMTCDLDTVLLALYKRNEQQSYMLAFPRRRFEGTR